MLTYRDIATALYDLQLPADVPILVHSRHANLAEVRGGSATVLSALNSAAKRLVFPAFTPATQVVPLDGPLNNGIRYGEGDPQNGEAVAYHSSLSAESGAGLLAEDFRLLPGVRRSSHPLLSFCGLDVETALQSQTLADPLAPLAHLLQAKGWVIHFGTDFTESVFFHYIERLAGRRHFIRWARVADRIVACANMPGCSRGFPAAERWLETTFRTVSLDGSQIRAYPMNLAAHLLKTRLEQDPLALLCDEPGCAECAAIRLDYGVESN
jgi:aminoglycoside 3-N-acetyltransferase